MSIPKVFRAYNDYPLAVLFSGILRVGSVRTAVAACACTDLNSDGGTVQSLEL